jgi:hypothetical protein
MFKSILSKVLGPAPATTVLGGAIAALMVIHEALKVGAVDWPSIVMAALVAALGFNSADAKK